MSSRLRLRLLFAVAATAVAAVLLTSHVLHGNSRSAGGLSLASSNCTTTGAFCVSSPSPGPVLFPGAAASNLPLTFANYSSVPLAVYRVTVSFTNDFPAGCASSAFQVNGTGAGGVTPSVTVNLPSTSWITIPAAAGSAPGTATYTASLGLADLKQSQNSCQKLGLHLSYSAAAYYTIPTKTVLSASPSPSTYAQPVMLTATVTPAISPASVGATPIGTVTFYECGGSGCSSPMVLGSSSVNSSTGVATLSTSFTPTGSFDLYAAYAPGCANAGCSGTAPDFKASQSTQITQVVNYTSCVTAKTGGNLTIGSGQDICITDSGSLGGNVTVNSGGRLDLVGGSVGGNIKVSSGGGLNISGGSVAGNVDASGANVFTTCGVNVSGNVRVSSSSPLVTIGNTSGCAGNTVGGGISVQGGTGGYQIVGNTTSGGITVTNNSGTPAVVSGNNVGGGLSCAGNTPAPSDSPTPNTVSGKRSGQCATPSNF